MAKQLNVNLAMTADTSQAKAQLQDLQAQLTKLSSIASSAGSGKFTITQELIEASSAAEMLKLNLSAATNVNTGKLDLGKFQQEMNKSQMSLEKYQTALNNLGPEGSQAFASLASSITKAEIPMRRSSALLSEFATTLKNTARWQISSSILHGFMGAISSAYGYAQDLNESLTNIRIVTGQTSEQMAQFAEQANKAAQSLSTTTTEYTKAALIFYQQGLEGDAVTERTDATIKMAHATGDSATEVSSYMTAIWNNFDDGSESLEHYADVITALGASTASSSSEIASGLEKFASIAETTGLSYDYATAALATLVANTRQSADTIGTSLKTIFSRLQGLSLGETLDDGTDLNKYSKALKTVGVDVLDATGQMRDLDSILTDLAGTWDTLTTAQQTALSQTVAGTRQYTQLMSLMNNWDDMEKNLSTAQNSDGTLDKQAEIYAESWEAARDRVTSAAEEIYNSLLDDDFFITITDGFAKFLNGVSDVIDGLGGLKGVLFAIGAVASTVFREQMVAGIENAIYNLKMLTQAGRDSVKEEQQKANKLLISSSLNSDTTTGTAMGTAYEQQSNLQTAYIENAEHLNEVERSIVTALLDQQQALIANVKASAEELENAENAAKIQQRTLVSQGQQHGINNGQNVKESIDLLKQSATSAGNYQSLLERVGEAVDEVIGPDDLNELRSFTQAVQDSGVDIEMAFGQQAKEAFDIFKADLQSVNETSDSSTFAKLEEEFNKLFSTIAGNSTVETFTDNLTQELMSLTTSTGEVVYTEEEARAKAEALAESYLHVGSSSADLEMHQSQLASYTDEVSQSLTKLSQKHTTAAEGLTSYAQTIMSVGMAITSVKGLIDTWGDSSKSAGEKVLTTLTTIGMVIPMLTSAFSANSIASMANAGAQFILATGFGSEAIAASVAEGATASFGAVLYTILWPLGLILAAILAVVGVVYLLVKAFEAIEAASPEGKLKAAQEEADNLSESLEDAQDKAQELQSAFDEYQTIIDKLNSCTKGTQEWSEALEEASAKTTELLQQYPELLSAANLFDENGLLNTEVLQDAVDQANASVDALSAASLMAQARVNEAQVNVNKQKYAEDNSRYTEYGYEGETYTNYSEANNDLQELLDIYKTTGSEALELSDAYAALGIDMETASDEVIQANAECANSLLELANQSIEAANSFDNAAKSVINDWANDNSIDLESGQAELMSDDYQNAYDDIRQAIIDADHSSNWQADTKDNSSLSQYDNKSVWDLYNEAMGTNYDLSSNGIQGDDNNRTYEYIGDDHEKHTVSIEEIADTIAASKALESLGESAESAGDILNHIDETAGEGIGAGLKDWISSGNFESMTGKDFEAMQSDIDDEGGSEAYLEKVFGMSSEELANTLGDDYLTQFDSALSNYDTALDSYMDGMLQATQDAFSNLDNVDGLTVKAQETIADVLQKAIVNGGAEGGQAMTDFLNTLSEEELSEFADIAGDINWNDLSLTDFKNQMADAGITTNYTDEQLQALINAMALTGAATEDLGTKYKSLHDTLDGLEEGDTIDADKYAELDAAYQEYFTLQADGTYKLIGLAEDLKLALQQNEIADYKSQMSSLQSENQNLTNVKDYNYDDLSQSQTYTGDDGGLKFDEAGVTQQIALVEALSADSEELRTQIAGWKEELASGTMQTETLDEITAAVQGCNDAYTNIDSTIQSNAESFLADETAMMTTATSLDELDRLVAEVNAEFGGVDYSAYAEGLMSVASQYDNCTEEIEDFKRALAEEDEEATESAETMLRLATEAGEAAEAYDLDADEVESYAKRLKKSYEKAGDSSADAARKATAMATANMRLDRGLSSLNDNIADYKKVLTSANKGTADWSNTMDDFKSSLADVLNMDMDSLSDDFAEATLNSDDLTKALDGDSDAILRLRAAAADDIIANLDVDDTTLDSVQSKWEQVKSMIQDDTIMAPGADQTELINTFNEMIQEGNMTKEQIESALAGLNVSADLDVKYNKITHEVPTTDEYSQTELVSPAEYDESDDGQRVLKTPATWKRHTWSVNGEPTMADEYIPQYTIKGTTGEGGVTTGITALPSPSASTSSTTSGKNDSGSGSGSKSPSSSSTSTPERKDKEHKKKSDIKDDYKKQDEEIERYHEIENTLDDLNDKVDEYDSAASRAFGGKKITALRQEAAALKQTAKAYGTYLDEIEKNLKSDKKDAKSYGWTFDEDGNVNNYDENMKALIKKQNAAEDNYLKEYNAAVDWWNSLTAEQQNDDTYSDKFDKLTEAAQKNLDKANESYNDAIAALDQYEETKELQEEKEKAQREALEKALDAEIEAVDATVEVKIEIDDNDLKYLQELLDNMGDGADTAAQAIANLGEQAKDLVGEQDENGNWSGGKAETYKEGIRGILSTYTDKEALGDKAISQDLVDKIMNGEELDDDDREALANAGMTEESISKLEDYQEGLIDVNSELRSLREDALAKVSDAFSEYTEDLDRASEKIEHLQTVTETYKDIIDIVGKKVLDASGTLTKELDRANFNMQRNNTAALKSELDYIDSSLEEQKALRDQLLAEDGGKRDGVHQAAIKELDAQIKDMEDERDSTYEDWLDSWEAECQAAADIYADTLETIVDNFSDSLAGAMGSLSELSEEFNRKKEIEDIYLDDYEQIYDLSKLTRDINNSIDDTDNIKSKKALKGLMEEIEEIQENGTKLSQYDLENLQKQYDLELAKQQLEEAQDAKSEVRMTRDAEGNYGYVYTADSSAVADAEQNYEDKLYAMQKANADYIEDLQSNIIQAEQDCADALAALDASQFASYEEYQAAVAQIQEDYNEKINAYYEQLDGVLNNNRDLYNTEWTAYSEMTGYKISADEDYVDSFDETRLSILTGFADITSAQDAWKEASANATNECAEAYYQWYQDTQTALSDGGTSIQDYGDTVDEVTEEVVAETEEIADKQEELAEKYKTSYDEILDALGDFCNDYDDQIQDIINSNNDLVKSINKVIKAAADLDENTDENGNTKTNSGNKDSNGNKSSGDNNSNKDSANTDTTGYNWENVRKAYNAINSGSWGTDSARIAAGHNSGIASKDLNLAQGIINMVYPKSLNGYGVASSFDDAKNKIINGLDPTQYFSKYYKFNTGGYTGDWSGDEGKFAMLHQKELVLNSDDTENILQAVDLIRQISDTIDLNALSASSGLASLLSSSSAITDNSSELQQNVTITAEFPNATDHSEIEEAFDNLVNRAAQFANRKN